MPAESIMLQVLTDKLYSLPTCTIFELFELYPSLHQSKALSNCFDNSSTNRSSFAKSVGIFPRDGTIHLLRKTKIVALFQAELELLGWIPQKIVTVKSLVSFQKSPRASLRQ